MLLLQKVHKKLKKVSQSKIQKISCLRIKKTSKGLRAKKKVKGQKMVC